MIVLKKILFIFSLLYFSCSTAVNNPEYQQLDAIAEYQLSIPEPSGVTFGKNYQSLWIVSDGNNGGIYQTTLQGETIQKIPFQGDDIEGICYDHHNDVFWIVEEQTKEIVKLDLSGNILLRQQIDFDSDSKHGFEGIALAEDGRIWLVHEKSPPMLFMLKHNFTIESQINPTAAEDYSGLHYSQADSCVWIVSDESNLLIKWNVAENNMDIYTIPVKKAEGVATDLTNETICIVSDKTAKLYYFSIK